MEIAPEGFTPDLFDDFSPVSDIPVSIVLIADNCEYDPSRLERDGFFMLIDSEAHGCCLSIGSATH